MRRLLCMALPGAGLCGGPASAKAHWGDGWTVDVDTETGVSVTWWHFRALRDLEGNDEFTAVIADVLRAKQRRPRKDRP